jgi:anti-sigma regulatory factor (Ser/Thr protein kinase)
MIRRNVELEARLIDDLLDLTRVARGKVDLQIQPCDAELAIRRAAEICESELEERRLRLLLDFSAPRRTVAADPARLQQIVWNLLKNSIKFSSGGGEIRISTECDSEKLVVRVTDEGIGIASDAIGRIFNAFEQGPDVSRRFGGLGLGLAISKTLADVQGGSLEAQSEGPNRGSAFTLRLPLTDAPLPAAAESSEPAGPAVSAPEQDRGAPLRILLVEDHHDTACALQRLLRANRHEVRVAGNVADALRIAGDEPFDLGDGLRIGRLAQYRKQPFGFARQTLGHFIKGLVQRQDGAQMPVAIVGTIMSGASGLSATGKNRTVRVPRSFGQDETVGAACGAAKQREHQRNEIELLGANSDRPLYRGRSSAQSRP